MNNLKQDSKPPILVNGINVNSWNIDQLCVTAAEMLACFAEFMAVDIMYVVELYFTALYPLI